MAAPAVSLKRLEVVNPRCKPGRVVPYDLCLTLLFKITYAYVDIPLDTFVFTRPDRCARAKLRPSSTSELQKSFTNCTIVDWSFLPASLTESTSVVAFKSGLARLGRSSDQIHTSSNSRVWHYRSLLWHEHSCGMAQYKSKDWYSLKQCRKGS